MGEMLSLGAVGLNVLLKFTLIFLFFFFVCCCLQVVVFTSALCCQRKMDFQEVDGRKAWQTNCSARG